MNRLHHYDGALLGAAIERSREHRGLDRAELGRRAGLSRMVVSNLELGKTRAFMEQIAGLAGALGIAPALLVAAASHEDRRLTRGERCMVVLHPEHWPARYGEVIGHRSGEEFKYRVRLFGEKEMHLLSHVYIRRMP